jgi:hypothetical protein
MNGILESEVMPVSKLCYIRQFGNGEITSGIQLILKHSANICGSSGKRKP